MEVYIHIAVILDLLSLNICFEIGEIIVVMQQMPN